MKQFISNHWAKFVITLLFVFCISLLQKGCHYMGNKFTQTLENMEKHDNEQCQKHCSSIGYEHGTYGLNVCTCHQEGKKPYTISKYGNVRGY